MSQRLQVVMSAAELEEVRDAAKRNRVTMSAWVRRVLRAAAGLERRGGAVAVRETRPVYAARASSQVRYVTVEARLLEADVEAVRKRYGLRSWKAAVEEAVSRQAVAPMTKEEALAMEGVGWDGNLDDMRDDCPVSVVDSGDSEADQGPSDDC